MDRNTLESVEKALAPLDIMFGQLLATTLGSHVGYAYLRTACVAYTMGESLPATWRKHGKPLLDAMEKELAAMDEEERIGE